MSNDAPQEGNLLTTAQVAAQLGVTVATVNRWVNAGTLPVAFQAHGIRGARYFHPDTVARMRTDVA